MKKPLVLMILDGYGIREETYGNAIKQAKTPVMDHLLAQWPHTQIGASGENVGLPEGQMGNSEVGHTNIGAGRIVYQDFTRITKAVRDKDFFNNQVLIAAMTTAKEKNVPLHLMGLLSEGGVHSHQEHLYALLEMAKEQGLSQVFVHCFMDGRDVAPTAGAEDIAALEKVMTTLGVGKIATVIGRYYAMDRDHRWERVQLAYDALIYGKGTDTPNPVAGVNASYNEGVTDEFLKPMICDKEGLVGENHSVIFFNFRPDRGRELTRALVDPDFDGFSPVKSLGLTMVTMTEYDATMPNVTVAYENDSLSHTFGEIISQKGLKQLRIAETEKYPHVTFFFNGGVETVYPGEDRLLIPSPKVATYDLEPEMSAPTVTKELLERLDADLYDAVILNFANGDMVGHSGILPAGIKAIETVDECMGKIVDKVLEKGGVVLITADHGNAEKMLTEEGKPFTAHTTNPVPFVTVGIPKDSVLAPPGKGRLCDISPTMLQLLDLPKPKEMTGESLIYSLKE